MYRELRKLLSPLYRYCEMQIKRIIYSFHKKAIEKSIKEKPIVNVAFFVVNLAMWKSENLFIMLKKDAKFNPVIVSMPRPWYSLASEQQEQQRLEKYCEEKGFNFIPGYDYNLCRFNGLNEIQPDIVFYTQPYNSGFKEHKIESFWNNSLFFYIPYCFTIEKKNVLANTLLKNICKAVFCESVIIKNIEEEYLSNHAANYIVTGSLCYDQICTKREDRCALWKQSDKSIKRVIWAPHHSILKTDILNYSNFLSIAEDMLQIARDYYGQIQFVFKPHPGLKSKLYELESWGKEKTDKYYRAWNDLPNSSLSEGEYFDLFRTSDALVHDSSSFTVEYLFTNNPVMYIAKSDHLDFMNDFGTMCFNMHYKGQTVSDVRSFLDSVVLDGEDKMKQQRESFVRDYLLPPNNLSAAENMYNYMVKCIL